MSQNPYSTILLSIGAIGLLVALMLFFGGSNADLNGLWAVGLAGMLFPVAGFSLVGGLLLEGVQWAQRAEVLVRD